MNTAWSKPTKYVVGVAIALLALFVLYLANSVIPLLILAALIAVIVRPLVNWLHYGARWRRGAAVAAVYLGLVILTPLAVLLIIPAIVDAVQYVMQIDYAGLAQRGAGWLRATLTSIRAAGLPSEALDAYVDRTVDALLTVLQGAGPAEPATPQVTTVIGSLTTALAATFGVAARVAGRVASSLVLLIFILLASIYISLGAHTYRGTFMRAVPVPYRPEIAVLLARIERMWHAFFRGQLTLMLIIGVVTWAGLTALGMPGALSLGILAGLLELVPNLGPILAAIPAVVVALLQGSSYLPMSHLTFALVVILFYILVQQLENSVVVPRVLGGAVDLPPLIVMTGVLVGATAFGILGALLATPVVASSREILGYVFRKMQGEEPFPPEEAAAREPEPRPSVGLGRQLQRLFRRGQ